MSLIWNEWKKNFCNIKILLAVLAGVLANVLILYITDEIALKKQLCDIGLYQTTYEQLEGMGAEEAVSFVEEQKQQFMLEQNIAGQYFTYDIIEKEVRQCLEYPSYLEKIEREANNHSQLAIFSDGDSYSGKNIDKTVLAFSQMEKHVLPIGLSKGVLLVTDNIISDIVILVLLMLVGIVLIQYDREKGMIGIYKSCKYGRGRLAIAKMISMMVYAVTITVLVCGSSILLGGVRYGFGDLTRQVQSVYGFSGCSLKLSVGSFLGIYVGAKLVFYVMFSLALLALMTRCSSIRSIYMAVILFLGVEVALYYGIRDNSVVMAFKYLNVFAFMNTAQMFETYRNIRLFGQPCDYRLLAIMLIAIGMFLSVILFYQAFCGHSEDVRRKNSATPMLFAKMTGASLVGNELYKIVFYSKNFLIFILAAILIRNVYVPISSIYSSMEDVYYHLCICEVEGSYTEEKNHYVEELFENPPQDKLENWDFYQLGYEKLIERMNHVSGLKNGVIFYERGYEQLTGQNRKMEWFHAMLCMFLVIILITPIWSIDHTTGMERLIDTTCNGKKVDRIKKWSALAIGAVVYLATYIPWNYNVLHTYGADYLGVSANNLQHLALLPDGITILGFMVGMHIVRLIVLCAVIFGIRFISHKNRSYLQALMVSTMVFLVPLFIAWILEV